MILMMIVLMMIILIIMMVTMIIMIMIMTNDVDYMKYFSLHVDDDYTNNNHDYDHD